MLNSIRRDQHTLSLEAVMTATREVKRTDKAGPESAPYSAGLLLCELFEAVETLETNVIFGNGSMDDAELAVQVTANLGARIRKQALAEGLVVARLGDGDGTTGRLSIGKALQAADATIYHEKERRRLSTVDEGAPSYTRDELTRALRIAQLRLPDVGDDLNEKLEAVQFFFEVEHFIPDTVQRPSSAARAAEHMIRSDRGGHEYTRAQLAEAVRVARELLTMDPAPNVVVDAREVDNKLRVLQHDLDPASDWEPIGTIGKEGT